MTTARKSSASKVGQAAKKAPAKKGGAVKAPSAPKSRNRADVQSVPDRRPANILAVMLVVLLGSLAAVGGTASYNAEQQRRGSAPATSAQPVKAVRATTTGLPGCDDPTRRSMDPTCAGEK